MAILDRIVNAYGLGTIKKVTAMTNGKSSHAWRVETDNRTVLVKTVASTDRASFEFALTQAIKEENKQLTPTILLTIKGQPFVTIDQQAYRVQEFWEQASIKPSFVATLESYRKIRAALDRFEYAWSPHDPHSLVQLWKSQQENFFKNWPSIYEQLASTIMQLERIERQQEIWIHGDLGRWNLLPLAKGRVAVIDFGEARLGPHFFDYAALFDGFMPEKEDALQAYKERFCHWAGITKRERAIFFATVQLWLVKGLLVAAEKMPEGVQNFWDRMQLVGDLSS